MLIFLGLLLPLLIYIAVLSRIGENRRKWLPYLVACISLLSTAAFFTATFLSNRWQGATQIIWRGIQSNEKTLTVGGNREGALIGWANQAFAPKFKAVLQEDKVAALEISDAGAFVFDQDKQVYLNGLPLKSGETQTVGDKQVVWRAGWFSDKLEIAGENNQILSEIELSKVSGKTRVDSLADLLTGKAVESAADARNLVLTEQWARDLKLLRSPAGEIRLLDRQPKPAACSLPCRLTLQWTSTQKQPIVLREEAGTLRMLFLPPWQQASPVPPKNKDGKYVLTVTARPVPGDIALVLPLGYGAADNKPGLELKEENRALIFADNAPAAQRTHFPDQRPPTEEERLQTGANLTSKIIVPLGNFSLLLATVNDLPSFGSVFWRFLLTLVCFWLGLFLVGQVLTDYTKAKVFYGLAACLWNFLVFRLLLAFRFAAEPNYLDNLTVKGVMLGFIALTLAPGFLFLWTRLRYDFIGSLNEKEKRRAWLQCVYYLLLCSAVVLVHWRMTPNLWVNLPERFFPSSTWMVFPVFIFLFLFGSIFSVYKSVFDRGYGFDKLRNLFLFFLELDKKIVRFGERFWDRIARDDLFMLVKYFAPLVLLLLALPLATSLLSLLRVPGNVIELIQETFILFFFSTAVGFVWLTAHFYFEKDGRKRPGLLRIISCLLLFLVIPLYGLPFLTGDTGTVLATISVFAFVMIFLLTRKFVIFGVAMFSALAIVIAFLMYFSLPISLPGEANVRLLVHHEKDIVPGFLLKAETEGEYQKLANAYRHSWETQAIAYQGGWLGMGFGDAPTRLSHVRQDTLQFDSLYSFFIVSENGLFGGLCLLLMYFLPLVLTLIGGWREGFNFGYAAASVIFGAFLLEAVLHAGMNLGAFPVTGRGMPLIIVNSVTDLFRWTFLFAFASQLLTWRDRFRSADSKKSGGNEPEAAENQKAVEFLRPVRQPGASNVLSRLHWVAVLLLPALFLTQVAVTNVKILRNKAYGEPFSWSGILSRTDNLIADRLIEVDQNSKTLTPKFDDYNVPDKAFIRQEILRFNALPENERLDNPASPGFAGQLNSIANPADFNNLMNSMRIEQLGVGQTRHPSLFRLLPPERWMSDAGVETRGGYRAASNPAFNTQTSFYVGVNPEDLSVVTFRDGETRALGPAWIAGKWVTVADPNSYLPWLKQLRMAMEAEWSRTDLGATQAKELYGKLTLDYRLHVAAANFAAVKGREIHRQMFVREDAQNSTKQIPQGVYALPPRVALAVINLPQGETLALGGYPRMTAFDNWRQFETGEWLPPADWVERKAPRDIRSIYGSDKNFQAMMVGSATKPILASAVLRVHRDLERRLTVRGNDAAETDVFGIQLVNDPKNGWETTPRPNWLGFTDYLAKSDNRYHLRLGFLGLASGTGGNLETAGNSPSNRESMDGGRTVWGKYPLFQNIDFAPNRPQNLSGLGATALALQMEKMYFFNAGQKNLEARYSFWTKNEADDTKDAARSATRLFEGISPEITDLQLNSVNSPRDYVTLLLGGGTNRWSNLELAAAFGTCVTGQAVVPHIVKNGRGLQVVASRESFAPTASLLHAGLSKVITDGTATEELRASGGLGFLNSLRGYEFYAKTGTLNSDVPGLYTSRIVLAIVQWENKAEGKARAGLVFSIVAEKTAKGSATRMLGEFLAANREQIIRALNER